ncbi:MAG: SDR family oxidoreductase, partial [Chloroflexota bacterium]|nr:SDR family oxidoreductase [Chloroflexota bacterium]
MGSRLKDKVLVITGAGRGIGRCLALACAAEGAKLVVNDLGVSVAGEVPTSGPADDVAKEIKASGGIAIPNYESVASMKGGENIIKAAVDNFGRIDVLVNNAGILRDRMIFNMTEQEWDAVIAVHLKGTFACTKPASILMRQQRSGCIINISSTTGLFGNAGQANYAAAKGGIQSFTRTVALDLGRYGVRCNCVAFDAIATRMMATVPGASPLSALPMGQPEDVVGILLWLATDQAANVNGQIFLATHNVVTLIAQSSRLKTIYKDGIWTLDELVEL